MNFGHRITYVTPEIGHSNMFIYAYQATQNTYEATRGPYQNARGMIW